MIIDSEHDQKSRNRPFKSSQWKIFCKKTLKNAFQKIYTLLLSKENVPKWNGLERILSHWEPVLGHFSMEQSRTCSAATVEALSIYFATFCLLSSDWLLWTHGRSPTDESLIHQEISFYVIRQTPSNDMLQSSIILIVIKIITFKIIPNVPRIQPIERSTVSHINFNVPWFRAVTLKSKYPFISKEWIHRL